MFFFNNEKIIENAEIKDIKIINSSLYTINFKRTQMFNINKMYVKSNFFILILKRDKSENNISREPMSIFIYLI